MASGRVKERRGKRWQGWLKWTRLSSPGSLAPAWPHYVGSYVETCVNIALEGGGHRGAAAWQLLADTIVAN